MGSHRLQSLCRGIKHEQENQTKKKKSTIYPIDASPAATKPLDLPCLKDREQVGPSAAALLLPLTLEYHPDLNFSLKILNYISFKTFFFLLHPKTIAPAALAIASLLCIPAAVGGAHLIDASTDLTWPSSEQLGKYGLNNLQTELQKHLLSKAEMPNTK